VNPFKSNHKLTTFHASCIKKHNVELIPQYKPGFLHSLLVKVKRIQMTVGFYGAHNGMRQWPAPCT